MTMLHLTKINTRGGYDEGETTAPVTIATDAIRCFYPRKNDLPGTRITFKDGGGFCVAEAYADVQRYVETGVAPEAPQAPAITDESEQFDEDHPAPATTRASNGRFAPRS